MPTSSHNAMIVEPSYPGVQKIRFPVRWKRANPSGSTVPRCCAQSRHSAAASHAVNTASIVE